ncbi:MAG: HDOD domain-containing protein [Planctomycetota bacterium]|jgi:HD-like signal output (HDOD) protein
MAGRDLKSIVDKIIDLPTLPQVVSTIVNLIDDPDSSVKDINDVMGQDPALVAKILKIVNSAFYGLPNRVSSISQAIVILGFNTVKSLALSASVLDMFGSGEEYFSYEDFWKHSIGCATICTTVAKKQPGVNADTAFVLGLMHDMGKLVLDQYAPVEFQQILKTAKEKEITFAEAEKEVIATSYTDIGYWLSQKWQLADDLADAIHHQNDLDECAEHASKELAAVCSFSEYVCRLKNYGHNGSYGKPELPLKAWNMLGMEKDQLPALIETINNDIHRADEFLEMVNG